jgi:hypothetical protein
MERKGKCLYNMNKVEVSDKGYRLQVAGFQGNTVACYRFSGYRAWNLATGNKKASRVIRNALSMRFNLVLCALSPFFLLFAGLGRNDHQHAFAFQFG